MHKQSSHSVALKQDGTVWAWGSNNYGQLGDETRENSSTPVQALFITDVTAIAAGSDYTVALKNDGTVWAWGGNLDGQLGVESSVAELVNIPNGGFAKENLTFTTNLARNFNPTYTWDFGDGNSLSGAEVQHLYTQAGTYIVTLTINANGDVYQTNHSISIAVPEHSIGGSVANIERDHTGTTMQWPFQVMELCGPGE